MQTKIQQSTASTYLNRRRHVGADARSRLVDFWDLVKPEITFLVGISSLAGFFLASGSDVDGVLLLNSLIGVILTSAGSGMLNHLMERDLDSLMRRTASRPLAGERVSPVVAGLLGAGLIASGVVLLGMAVNTLTMWLAIATVVAYLGIYTPLKRRTKYNTIVGCVPGALPALGGWTAAEGSIGTGGLVLFAILFAWQMPHFLSLAWMYRKDYARADFAMLPVVEPDGKSTAIQTVAFTAIVILLSLLPFMMGMTGLMYLVLVLASGAFFLRAAFRFYRTLANGAARKVLLASVVYIPTLVAAILIDAVGTWL